MTPEALDALVTSGATVEMIAAAWKAEMVVRGNAVESRRHKDAERKRKERARPECHADIDGQEGTERDIADPLSLDKEIPPRPPKEIKPNPVCVTPARKGTRISERWQPAKPLPANVKALSDQWPPGRYERELEGFGDYWSSRQRNATMLDWDKGWWNRIRDQHDRIMRENGNGRPNTMGGNRGASASGRGSTVDAAQRVLARHGYGSG